MNWFLIILFAIIAFFLILQFISNRTYKPKKEEIKTLIQSTIEGTIDWKSLDEFSCVKIAYNAQLDTIRIKFNSILEKPECIVAGEFGTGDSSLLTESGKTQLRKLIEELAVIQIK